MEGRVFPDQEQLLLFLRRLKEVFDVCDDDSDGFVRVEHLVELGLQFGQGEEVKKLTSYLDPNAYGKVNFKDFCHGVLAIKGCEEIQKLALGPCSLTPALPCVTDNGYLYQNDEAKLGPPFTMCTRSYPQSSVYGDGCNADGEYDMESNLDPHNPAQQEGHLIGSVSASVITVEEQFEDYGEGEDIDFSNPCPEDDTRTNGFSGLGSSVSSSARETPQKMSQLYNSELLDIYCSQCCKKVNLLNDLEARLRNLKANSPNRKISSTAFGRQLFQANYCVFGPSQASSTEDLFTDSIDSCDLDITDKVSYLEKKVTELESDCRANGDIKSKLKQENTQLVHRVHWLEEQMKDAEARADQSLEEEAKEHREAYNKMERDRTSKIELLCNRVHQLGDDNGEMKINVCRLKSQTEKLDQEKQWMTDKVEDTSMRLKDELDIYKKIMDRLWHNRREFRKEKEAMQELIDDLHRELDYLQLFKMDVEHPRKGKGLSDFNGKTREVELEYEVRRLKQDNLKLRDQNDDLNAQILSLSLYDVKNLFTCPTKAQCLAAEIDNASRDELVDALKEQEEINHRLRNYMDKIILAILDHDPSILEIKS
ncbi:rab11 family-interacting protein 4A [Genypterus blacodes]|uniref:rab11 family-interacting protein 4A n=1 Tax=Genypterus blacodes TaxID=154954 RepID=UPI003F75EA92